MYNIIIGIIPLGYSIEVKIKSPGPEFYTQFLQFTASKVNIVFEFTKKKMLFSMHPLPNLKHFTLKLVILGTNISG